MHIDDGDRVGNDASASSPVPPTLAVVAASWWQQLGISNNAVVAAVAAARQCNGGGGGGSGSSLTAALQLWQLGDGAAVAVAARRRGRQLWQRGSCGSLVVAAAASWCVGGRVVVVREFGCRGCGRAAAVCWRSNCIARALVSARCFLGEGRDNHQQEGRGRARQLWQKCCGAGSARWWCCWQRLGGSSLAAATTWRWLRQRDSATVAAAWRRRGRRLWQLGSGKVTAPGMGGRHH